MVWQRQLAPEDVIAVRQVAGIIKHVPLLNSQSADSIMINIPPPSRKDFAKRLLEDAQMQQKLHLNELKRANALLDMAMSQRDSAQYRADKSRVEVENAKKLLREVSSGSNNKKRGRTDPLCEEGNKKPAAQNTPASTNVDINNNNNVDEVEGCAKGLFRDKL